MWKHILNVYPDGMTGKERMDYIKKKANEYYALRSRWKDCIQKGRVRKEIIVISSISEGYVNTRGRLLTNSLQMTP